MDFDFSFFLVIATLLTGIIWGGYIVVARLFPPNRPPEATEPVLLEYSRSFFPILLTVLLLRSFLVEPFRIPSGSMMPTLLIGDFILVNKFVYGVRLPVVHTKVMDMGQPQRGDIVVFRFPGDTRVDYIKRVIGLPGDKVAYYNKQLFVNGTAIVQTELGEYEGQGQGRSMSGARLKNEDLTGVNHDILIRAGQPTVESEWVVPTGHYFVMGDNRDNSNDSRYWGMVPEANLLGKAFLIWMNLDIDNGGIAFERLGTRLH
ncbi:MAG: signal peptidase I [Methylococcaceae bacterium]